MTQSSTPTLSSSELSASLDLVEVKPGVKFSKAVLMDLLPDAETVLFFGKVYGLDYVQLSSLMHTCIRTDLSDALFGEGQSHSNDLQGYLLGGYEHDEYCAADEWEGRECTCTPTYHEGIIPAAQQGDVTLDPDVPKGEILPEVWADLEVDVAQSIKDVAAKLESVVGLLPGKQGHMTLQAMMKMNRNRPTIGQHGAVIGHARQQQNLLILDVSGSMNEHTVGRIINDVVALSYVANAHMAIVSDDCTYWEPGTYDVDDVLARATYGGTHYETLKDLLNRDWGTVITVADYDSSLSAKQRLTRCTGHIDLVLDISLVSQPTFLAECVGQMATEVRPLLVGTSYYVLT